VQLHATSNSEIDSNHFTGQLSTFNMNGGCDSIGVTGNVFAPTANSFFFIAVNDTLTNARFIRNDMNPAANWKATGFNIGAAWCSNVVLAGNAIRTTTSMLTVDASFFKNIRIIGNTIIDRGMSFGAGTESITVQKNNFLNLPASAISYANPTGAGNSFIRNWWGSTDTSVISGLFAAACRDSLAHVPFRLGAVDTSIGGDTVAPRAPDTVSATALSDTMIQLSWATVTLSEEPEAALNLAGYRVWRTTSLDSAQRGALIAAGTGGTPVLLDSGLTPSTQYFYRVTAFDNHSIENQSFFSDSIATETTISPGPPASFGLLAPVHGLETNVTTIAFRWENAADTNPPVTYRLLVDTAGTFVAPAIDTTVGVDTFLTLWGGGSPPLPINSALFWRVIAQNSLGETTVAGDSSLLIDTIPPSAPGLSAPAVNLDTNAVAILFQWTGSTDTGSGVNRYHLQIDTSGLFSNLLVDSSAGLALSGMRTLPANETYYWRVMAFDDATNSMASTSQLIRIDTAPPSSPTLIAPANGFETSATTISFSWSAAADSISGVAGYRLQVDTTNTFLSNVVDTVTALTSVGLTLPANETYYWRAAALDSAGNSAYAAARTLVIDTTPPHAFTLNRFTWTTSIPCTYSIDFDSSTNWTWADTVWASNAATPTAGDSHSGLNRFHLQISSSPTFAPLIKDSTIGLARRVTDTIAVAGTYYLRIVAYDDVGNMRAGTWGGAYTNDAGWGYWKPLLDSSFVVELTPPSSPTLVAPTGGQVLLESAALSWTASNDIGSGNTGRHRLEVAASSDFAAPAIAGWVIGTSTTAAPAAGTWYWRIKGEDRFGNAALSSPTVESFVIASGARPSPPPGLSATAGDRVVNLAWYVSEDTTVTGYLLYRGATATGPWTTLTATPLALLTPFFSDTSVVNDATYFYHVRARTAEGLLSDSSAVVSATPTSDTSGGADVTAPVITHAATTAWVVNTPLPLSAAITDDRGVASAALYYRVVGGATWASQAMNFSAPSTWSGTIPADSVTLAGLTYRITALDAAGNPARSGTETNPHLVSITAADSTGPMIQHTPPANFTIGAPGTIEATMTDPSGIATATLWYRRTGDAAFFSTAMSLVSDSLYRGTVPADSVTAAGVDYRIGGRDAANNDSITGIYSIPAMAGDVTPPVITHTPLSAAGLGSSPSISAQVTDNIGVTQVALVHASLYGAFETVVLATSDNLLWTGAIPATRTVVADTYFRYYISARDAAGNISRTPASDQLVRVTAGDTAPPAIIHYPATTASAGVAVPIEAIVTDDSAGVAAVTLYWRQRGDLAWKSTVMTESGGRHAASIPADSVTTLGLEYAIAAIDSAANGPSWAQDRDTANPFAITVSAADITPPTVYHDLMTPKPAGQAVLFSAIAADDQGIASVTLLWRALGETPFQQSAMTAAAGVYSATLAADSVLAPEILYYIEARDAAGNAGRSGTETAPNSLTVYIPDSIAPVIAHTPVVRGYAARPIALTAFVTETGILSEARLHWRTPGGLVYSSETIAFTGAWQCSHTIVAASVTVAGIEYYLSATDISGNVGYAAGETNPYRIHIFPVATDLTEARSYPNPWTPSSGEPLKIHRLPADRDMVIEIYDRGGGLVDRLTVGAGIEHAADGNTATWLGRTLSGRRIAPGVYSVVIRSHAGARVIRMTIVP
jgi:hypothetical protein